MKKILSAVLFVLAGSIGYAQTKWSVDNAHSSVGFSVPHLLISEVEGNFKKFNGSITAAKPDFSDARVEFAVDVNSIDTDSEMRDNHLKAEDFFNASQFPTMTFKSTSFKKVGGNKYELAGNLTIRNKTNPVKFLVTYGGTANDGYGNTKAGFKATTTINRFDYDLTWNKLTEAGGATVGKEVTLNLKLQFAKAKA